MTMRRVGGRRLSCTMLFFLAARLTAGITLTRVPLTLIPFSESVEIAWKEPVEASLRVGTVHHDYSTVVGLPGLQRVSFVPEEAGLDPGVYFGVISDGTQSSEEFTLYVESPNAPTMVSPSNQSEVQTVVPEFRWEGVAGVPFSYILLSDREVTLEQDEEGEYRLEGANIIWQAITPAMRIRYGEVDPSGIFTALNGEPLPLLAGLDYNWVVLNNYANTPAYTSLVQGGVFGFTVGAPSGMNPPDLQSPEPGAVLSDAVLGFTWQPVFGADHYLFTLSEEREVSGSSSSYTVWSETTQGDFLDLDARGMLRGAKYLWRVVAVDDAGRGAASAFRSFVYDVPKGGLRVLTREEGGGSLPRVSVRVTPEEGSVEGTMLLTLEGSLLETVVQPGTYLVEGMKSGFADTSAAVDVPVDDTTTVTLRLRRMRASVSGMVENTDGQVVAGAEVFALHAASGTAYSGFSDASGVFRIVVDAGRWEVRAEKADHGSSPAATVDVLPGGEGVLAEILVLIPYPSRFQGEVRTSGGQPVPQARLRMRRGEEALTAMTDGSGQFSASLDAGTWELRATKPGFVPSAVRSVALEAGESRTIAPALVLPRASGTVSGYATDGDRRIGGADVRIVPLFGQGISMTTGVQGEFNVGLLRRPYSVRLGKEGYGRSQSIQVPVWEEGTEYSLEFVLDAAAEVRGSVTLEGGPAVDATVRCETASSRTGSDGRYALFVPAGRHRVTAVKRGCYAPPVSLTVEEGQTATADFTLSTHAATLEGTVRTDGDVVGGAFVEARSGGDTLTVPVEDVGTYQLGLHPGVWRVRADAWGYAEQVVAGLSVGEGQVLEGFDFSLIPSYGTLRGTVRGSGGGSIPGAELELMEAGVHGISSKSGEYAMVVEPGTFTVMVSKDGTAGAETSVTVGANAVVERDFVLPPLGGVRGCVTDESGRALMDIDVQAFRAQGSEVTETDYAGEYRLFLEDGAYTLTADAWKYAPFQETITVSNGMMMERDIVLAGDPSEVLSIRGDVVDYLGRSLPGARIHLEHAGRTTLLVPSGGAYLAEELEGGKTYSIRPSASGRFFEPVFRLFAPLEASMTDQGFRGSVYGDVSGNEKISSFDGSLVLRVSAEQDVSPDYTDFPRDSIAADVSGNGDVSAFDASLIFRYAVSLIDAFPVEGQALGKGAGGATGGDPCRVSLHVDRDGETRTLEVEIENPSGFYSLELKLAGPEGVEVVGVLPGSMLRDCLSAHSVTPDRIVFAAAGKEKVFASGTLLRVAYRVEDVEPERPFHTEFVRIDEGRIPVEFTDDADAAPERFALYQNFPNPFNADTVIRYDVPQTGRVEIHVFNTLGQRVATLVDRRHAAGAYRIGWNGRDDAGLWMASGIYFIRINAGHFVAHRKALLVR